MAQLPGFHHVVALSDGCFLGDGFYYGPGAEFWNGSRASPEESGAEWAGEAVLKGPAALRSRLPVALATYGLGTKSLKLVEL